MTRSASDQRLAFSCRHNPLPMRDLFAPGAIEVREFADVVHFDADGTATEFARAGFEPFEQLRATRVRHRWPLVDEDGVLSASDRKAPN